MRVIAGKARRLPLKTVPGLDTRPTTDRIKETLFNVLQDDLYNCRFLDLFSGSGAIGIEALSRGAKTAFFVEKNRKAVECIKENLRFTRLEDQAAVMAADVFSALGSVHPDEPFSIIFMDPPYDQQLEMRVLDALKDRKDLADDDTLMIVEASLETDFSWLEEMGYQAVKKKKYKTNQHVFIRRMMDLGSRSDEESGISGEF